jgi:hypothetical protein
MCPAVTEQADRFTLTTGRDGRVLLSLALRRHPWADATQYVRAQRYWACAPGGGQPRWLVLPPVRGVVDDPEDARQAADAHGVAMAYLPGVFCSGCGDRRWQPVDRAAVTRYVLCGATGTCLSCRVVPAEPEPEPAARPFIPSYTTQTAGYGTPQTVDGRFVGSDAAPAYEWGPERTDVISRKFGLVRAVGGTDLVPVPRSRYLGDL